jgi:hypothetical protein
MLAIAITITPFYSIVFIELYEVFTVMGCVAIAIYVLSHFINSDKDVAMTEKERKSIIKKTMWLCVMLVVLIICLLSNRGIHTVRISSSYYVNQLRNYYFNRYILDHNPISELMDEEVVNFTDKLGITDSRLIDVGAVSILLKNGTFFSKYNIELWLRNVKWVPELGFMSYSGNPLEDCKREFSKNSRYYNSLELDQYDGISNVLFLELYTPQKVRDLLEDKRN